MKTIPRNGVLVFGLAIVSLCSVPDGGLLSEAQARVGRPATPVSYAGVARRTTVRAATPGVGAPGVGVTPAPGVGTLGPVGTVVYALPSVPSGCIPTLVNGIEYQRCESTWYQVQNTGSSVQYIIVAPP